ncbi:hypothetical protein SacmaDRAFT_1255 [Saccharomonospora marina XMU15]|uniref:Uncharacterized protein n=2 Tax=Saccharomonospora TaxID=1851 RepID=H5WYE5_9PSEU|nr:hypothetical protein SacmaDRAFT_1255 [Saccharomonospora marina XMU15]
MSAPVLAAALVSVPAVFLTTTGGPTAVVGQVLNWLSLAVLVGESLLLLWLSGSVTSWVRRYRAQLLIVGLAVPAVVFVVGPLQILRLLLAIGALRVLRVGRIMRAARVVSRKFGLRTHHGRWVLAAASVLAVVFVAVVLADPDSRSRAVVLWVVDRIGVVPAVLALLGALAVLALAVTVVRRRTWRPHER